eukprot:1035636-Prorocentrum_minimum.AAC.1
MRQPHLSDTTITPERHTRHTRATHLHTRTHPSHPSHPPSTPECHPNRHTAYFLSPPMIGARYGNILSPLL